VSNIIVIEVGKNYSKFEELAYLKEENYCLLNMDSFVWYIGTCLNDPYLAQQLLSKYMGITPIHANVIVQINKYDNGKKD
jgi:hypothetical protein